jgi:hypothetical protein
LEAARFKDLWSCRISATAGKIAIIISAKPASCADMRAIIALTCATIECHDPSGSARKG